MSKSSPSVTPANGSPVTLRTVLPQPSREERPASEISSISFAASGSGTWWIWMFWRVVMWPLFERRVLLDHRGEGVHLVRGDAAHRQLHADHLHVGLALAVDALLEAEADELLLGLVAAHERAGLGVEVLELALEDRDHVPGDVLVDLGVLERAALALRLLRLLVADVELVLGGDAMAGVLAGAVRATAPLARGIA